MRLTGCARTLKLKPSTYNAVMSKFITRSLIGAALLCLGAVAFAQTEPARAPDGAEIIDEIKDPAPGKPQGPQQPTVRIHQQDRGSTIDELRVGSQTQEINVQPAGRAPAYQVRPNNNNTMRSKSGAHSSDGANGPRVWNVIKF